jgi:hypothetical protein
MLEVRSTQQSPAFIPFVAQSLMYGNSDFGTGVDEPSERIGWQQTERLATGYPDKVVHSMLSVIRLTDAQLPFMQLFLKWPGLLPVQELPDDVLTVTTRHLIKSIGLSDHQAWCGSITNEEVFSVRSIISLVHPVQKEMVSISDPKDTLTLEAKRLSLHYDWRALATPKRVMIG